MRPVRNGSRVRLNTFKEISMHDAQNAAPPLFIIVVEEALVARDIELTILELRPEAVVIVTQSLGAAAAALPEGRLEAAFVQGDAESSFASFVGQRILRDGGHLILVGREADDLTAGCLLLPFPFAQADVAALLSAAVPSH
jgi:hypothetical protein